MLGVWFQATIVKEVTQISWFPRTHKSYDYIIFPGGSDAKESACNAGDLGWEAPVEKGMATHSSILAYDAAVPFPPGGSEVTLRLPSPQGLL